MAYLIGIPTLILLAVVQSTILSNLRLLDGSPDLVLLAVVAWALTKHPRQAMILGLIGGLTIDLLSGLPLGVSGAIMVGIAFVVSLVAGRFWEAHFLIPIATVLGASIVYQGLLVVVLLVMGQPIDPAYAVGRVLLPSAFLNLVLALPAAQAAASLSDTLYPPEVQI